VLLLPESSQTENFLGPGCTGCVFGSLISISTLCIVGALETLGLLPCVPSQGYGNKKFVFQGVHETICYGPADQPWKEGEVPVNQIVFIGRDLDRKVRAASHGLAHTR